LTTKVLKKTEVCKAKIAVREDFALAETFFALAESRPTPQTLPFTHFKHREPTMKWQKNKTFLENLHDFTEKVVILHSKRYD